VHVRIMQLILVAIGLAAGCGAECGGRSIPHCPGPGGAECVDGAWHCFLFDLSGEIPPDLSSPRD
jgi:hypothetical protein